ncbi:Pyruvate kinase 2 [Nymphaea thermarum]|nr:Pyruvate kinase 2 [Nymphaea thermarum]
MEESLRLASVLTPSKQCFFPSLTKIVGTLGPNTRSIEVIEECLKAGMSVARFDFSWLDSNYHQETLDNLKVAAKNVKKLYSVMLDTLGPEIQVHNKTGNPIDLKADDHVILTPDLSKEPSAMVLPVSYAGLAEVVKKGDTIFIGQYLFTGSETTSVWLEVLETNGADVVCLVKNSAALAGFIFTMQVSQVHINLPTLSDFDKQLRDFLQNQNLSHPLIYAKVESVEGLTHFDEILEEADGIILSRGNLGIDLPPEKKSAVHKCNMAGKPAIVTRVVDSMTGNLRPTRAEATDVANAVLDGTDGILLGAETLRGLYPVETIRTVGRICAEAEVVSNQSFHFKRIIKHVGEPMSHEESVASSAVRAATKVKAAVIVVFTSTGRAARLIAKYRPSMPVLAVVIPTLMTNSLKWTFSGSTQARQCLAVRGVYPILATPARLDGPAISTEESGLALALEHGKNAGLVKPHDRIVVFEKIGDSSVVKIVEVDN